ncbi:MAG: DUF1194 domain-containing protein [Amylibacter sp.]|nr:DUF1194 domain-containing protein [Amylibacter sp.]
MAQSANDWRAAFKENTVDLTLVIALDVSYSVDAAEFRLMRDGLASALDSDALEEALRAGLHGVILISVVQWSGFQEQDTHVKWRRVSGRADLAVLADDIRAMKRRYTGGATDIGGALSFCHAVVKTAPEGSIRQVIDLVADGKNNVNFGPQFIRDIIVPDKITINGLAITNEVDGLVDYFKENIIGGNGAFVEAAAQYADFERAMARKLVRETQNLMS